MVGHIKSPKADFPFPSFSKDCISKPSNTKYHTFNVYTTALVNVIANFYHYLPFALLELDTITEIRIRTEIAELFKFKKNLA